MRGRDTGDMQPCPWGGGEKGGPMRNAAHRRQDDAPPGPPRDLAADAATLLDLAGALVGRLEAGEASARLINETVVLGIQLGDLTAALEDAAAGESVVEAVDRAAYARGWDARGAAGQQPSRPRQADRRRHLAPVPGLPATAARVAAAGIVAAGLTGGIVAGAHDESSVRTVAAAPARHAALHRMVPDRAAVIPPSRWSPPARPSVAAAAASPVPTAVLSPAGPASSPPPAPVPSVTAAPGPALAVQRLLDLGDSILGQLQLSATGPEEVAWTATTKDGVVLSSYAGIVVPGEPVTLTVTFRPGGRGWIYVSFGGTVIPVEVTSGLGVPALALPSGL